VTLTQYAPNSNPTPYRFAGFGAPNFTQVPDIFFDEIAPNLTEAELRVALYIIRRTFGWMKEQDRISLRQMGEGIRSRVGEVIDRGTGMTKAGVLRGVTGLVEKDVITTVRNSSAEWGDEATTYRWHFEGDDTPVSTKEIPPCLSGRHPRVYEVDTQNTEEQNTIEQGEFEISKDSPIVDNFVDNFVDNCVSIPTQAPVPRSQPIVTLITDFSREMGDTKHLGANITQAHRIFQGSGMGLDTFFETLYEARLRTRKTNRVANRMAYFFTVARNLAANSELCPLPSRIETSKQYAALPP
jgi:hypothetical protein